MGSINMDFVANVDHLPAEGETILAKDFRLVPGGKGANQSYAIQFKIEKYPELAYSAFPILGNRRVYVNAMDVQHLVDYTTADKHL